MLFVHLYRSLIDFILEVVSGIVASVNYFIINIKSHNYLITNSFFVFQRKTLFGNSELFFQHSPECDLLKLYLRFGHLRWITYNFLSLFLCFPGSILVIKLCQPQIFPKSIMYILHYGFKSQYRLLFKEDIKREKSPSILITMDKKFHYK